MNQFATDLYKWISLGIGPLCKETPGWIWSGCNNTHGPNQMQHTFDTFWCHFPVLEGPDRSEGLK